MIGDEKLPEGEKLFRKRYKKAPSFFSMHLGVRAEVLPPGTDCHHVILEDWDAMEDSRATLFLSMPTLLDPSLAPAGRHIVHAFTPDWIDAWQDLSPDEYERKKEEVADALCKRIEAVIPGLRDAIVFREVRERTGKGAGGWGNSALSVQCWCVEAGLRDAMFPLERREVTGRAEL